MLRAGDRARALRRERGRAVSTAGPAASLHPNCALLRAMGAEQEHRGVLWECLLTPSCRLPSMVMALLLLCRLVYDRETGKPKGYGFCEYQDQETALSAMRNLNGREFSGRALRVDNAASEKNKEELKSESEFCAREH